MKQKIVLIVSVVIGLLAAILTRAYLAAKDAEVDRMKVAYATAHGVIDALVYSKAVPVGTVLSEDNVGHLRVPAAGIQGHALTRQEHLDVMGRKIITSHKKGEVVFWADIEGGNPLDGGLAADIKKTMRAVSINASGAAAVSGMVKPNDHVDVIGTFSFPAANATKPGQTELVTCTILQNVLVLATGRETAKSSARSGYGAPVAAGYSTVTLEVTLREAEMLAFAEQIKGRLSLALRNRNDGTYERELPKVDFAKIRAEIEELNLKRQTSLDRR